MKNRLSKIAAFAGAAAAATLILTGILIAGAEVNSPAWWPWANLAGAPLMLSGLGLYRLLQPPAPEAVISGLLPRPGGRDKYPGVTP